jgi:hypothetical protein
VNVASEDRYYLSGNSRPGLAATNPEAYICWPVRLLLAAAGGHVLKRFSRSLASAKASAKAELCQSYQCFVIALVLYSATVSLFAMFCRYGR